MCLELTKTEKQLESIEEDVGFDDELLDEGAPSPYAKYLTKTNSFIVFVLIPSVMAMIYYGFLVSKQYTTEVRMIVRTIGVSEKFDTSEDRAGRSIIGGDSLTQDSYIVASYLKSVEMVETLQKEIGLRQLFSKHDIDFISRLSGNASIEALHSYWISHIDTYVDGPSGIIIFRVRAFSPQDSLTIMNAAMVAANNMIDKISQRAESDLIARAEADLAKSLAQYQDALNALRSYQNQTGVLDPISKAQLISAVISKLIEKKLGFVVELDALKAANANNSARARQLSRTINALDQQIKQRQDSLAGRPINGFQLSENLTEFAKLETRRVVAKAIYEATVRNLDTARSAALKRTTFISVFSNASLPQESRYPARLSAWIIFCVGMFTLWVSATLIWMSIQDHRV